MTLFSLKYRVLKLIFRLKNIIGWKYTYFYLVSGEYFRIRNKDKLGKKIFIDGIFEPKFISDFNKEISKGDFVLDVGANIGYFTVQFARICGRNGRVMAVEANPIVFKELETNIKLNNYENVTPINIALSDISGEIEFSLPSEGTEAYGSIKSNSFFKTEKIITVESTTVDECIMSVDRVPSVVKIDVEGAEMLVLKGAERMLSDFRPVIYFECTEELAEPYGYKLFDLLFFMHEHDYELREMFHGFWKATPKEK